MRGRAYQLLTSFRSGLSGAGAAFAMSRLILRARIIPENITPELDDPAVEQRLAAAIEALQQERAPGFGAGRSGGGSF
jgi:hypothetical protein